MFELVVAERDELLERGFSRRLVNRLLAWRNEEIIPTLAVIECATPDSVLEKFLLAKNLLLRESFRANFYSLLAAPEYHAAQDAFDLALIENADQIIIATQDEMLAEKNNSLPPSPPTDSQINEANLTVPTVSSLSTQVASPFFFASPLTRADQRVATALPYEAEKLRVQIFTAISSAEKISALRQLLFSSVDVAKKLPVFMQALADTDGELRAAAARGISNLGIPADLTETMATFAEKREINLTAERLLDKLPTAENVPLTAVVMLLTGCVRDRNFQKNYLLITLRTLTRLIQKHDVPIFYATDFFRILQERMFAENEAESFREIFAALQRKNSVVAEHFVGEILQSNSAEYRGLLFSLLGDWDLADDRRQEILPAAVAVFAALPTDSEKSFAARNFIGSCGENGWRALNAELPQMPVAAQRAAIRFTDNWLRGRPPFIPLAETCRQLLNRSPLALRVDILETRVGIRRELPTELRAAITETLARDYTDYLPLGSTLENALVLLASPAPLLSALTREKDLAAASLLANALGKIGVENTQHAENILRELVKKSFANNAAFAAVTLAIGEIAANPNLSGELNAFTRRLLLERLQRNENSPALLIAASKTFLGALTAVDSAEINFIRTLALRHLAAENLAVGIEQTTSDDEEIFAITTTADAYLDLIPAALTALQNLATAMTGERQFIIAQLLIFATKSAAVAVNWGLANETKLWSVLGKLGALDCEAEQRMQIAMALAKRAEQTTALAALAEILAIKDDRTASLFDRMAVSLINRVLANYRDEKNMEEREILLRILFATLRRGQFAGRRGEVERMLSATANVYLSAIRDGLTGAWRQMQILLSEKVFADEDLLKKINDELFALTSLARR